MLLSEPLARLISFFLDDFSKDWYEMAASGRTFYQVTLIMYNWVKSARCKSKLFVRNDLIN